MTQMDPYLASQIIDRLFEANFSVACVRPASSAARRSARRVWPSSACSRASRRVTALRRSAPQRFASLSRQLHGGRATACCGFSKSTTPGIEILTLWNWPQYIQNIQISWSHRCCRTPALESTFVHLGSSLCAATAVANRVVTCDKPTPVPAAGLPFEHIWAPAR